MAVTGIEITSVTAYEGGEAFGPAGPYERLDGVARYAVDPDHPANGGIVDLVLVPRGADGLVHFEGDVTILRPADPARGNGTALLEVPNRGRRTLTTLFNQAVAEIPPAWPIAPGDGFLFRRGFTLAWVGWQWDVPRGPGRMGLAAPRVSGGAPGFTQLRFQLPVDAPTVLLTDQHVGPLGAHDPIPTVDVDDPVAVLYRRKGPGDDPEMVPRDRWRFADPVTLAVDGGLRAGVIYDLVYRLDVQPVVGAGLLAARDLASHLRWGRSPLCGVGAPTEMVEAKPAGAPAPEGWGLQRVIITGLSQNSRFLRHLLWLGLDADEAGQQPAFDGLLGIVGGGRRGEFNHRYAQPSVQPTPGFGHLFPFADAPQTDPRTGRTAGLLDAVAAHPRPPRIVLCDSSAEYWRGDASLAHTSVADGSDVEAPPFVRRYLFAGTQHSSGPAYKGDLTIQGTRGANLLNMVDYRPLYRAALVNLNAWIAEGAEPPPSAVPRWSDGTAATREDVLAALASIPGAALPAPDEMPVMRALDLGPEAGSGVGRYPAVPFGPPYPTAVSAVDGDGNEVAGVAMPDVTVPLATHTGFNPRHPEMGAPGQLMEYFGSTIPFAATLSERVGSGDPRASVEERYTGLDDYLAKVRAAAEALMARRHLLAEDVELCVELAHQRWALLVSGAGR
ncbi:MAG: alpha/beta hydrolase domain-containing protein [Acidimicrobiia bacterium]|nr:alpha/beta hydrolase domain-containing protein [Acidimicrobiia bacterium]